MSRVLYNRLSICYTNDCTLMTLADNHIIIIMYPSHPHTQGKGWRLWDTRPGGYTSTGGSW